jgi:hypothetical protein
MMDFYVISPLSNLEPMKLGDRLFVLAHLWIKDANYREFVRTWQKENPDGWITLDNSAAERSLVTEDVLIKICHELMPSEVIAPDVLFDKDATITNAKSFRDRMEAEGLLNKIDIFFCPQGKTKEDWLEAYMWAMFQDWINVVGFSKIAVPNAWLSDDHFSNLRSFKEDQGIKEARHMAYDYLKERDMLKKPIHCLGQGDPTEFSYYDHPMMRSTDSVFPVLAAAFGQDFREDHTTRIPTPHNFLETFDMSDVDMELVSKNVQYLRLACLTGK